jgi:DNA-binding MarR family transcriptional regulator
LELGTYLPYLVNRVGQQFISDITPVLGKAGVDIQSWRVLIALYQRGGQPVGALSDLTSINFSTLSRVLGRMEKKDLIRRMRDADDARSFTVELTATGRSVTETILPQAVALEAKVTGDFSEAELAMLRQLLGKLYAGLEGDVNETDDRLAG